MLEFYGNIYGVDGRIPDVDSVKVDLHKADIVEGHNAAYIEYAGPAGTLDSGDDIVIDIYLPTGYNGYYSIDINAVTDPSPDADAGNMTGEVVKGVINSGASDYFMVYVGNGDAYPVGSGASANPD